MEHHEPRPEAVEPDVIITAHRFRPYGDWVVVKLDELSQFTDGKHGIAIHRPNRVADWTAYGRVLAIGPGPRDPKTGIRARVEGFSVGDHVVFDWRPSHEKEETERLCGPRTLLLRADEIVGLVEVD